MMEEVLENGFIIDLSSTKNTTQLVYELSQLLELPEVQGKEVYLKLGSIDLKQSQLLSIKALIESMHSTISFIDTASEQTEASAISLALKVSKLSNEAGSNVLYSSEKEIKNEEAVNVKEESVENETNDYDDFKTISTDTDINTINGVEDIYNEESTQELSEIIQSETFSSNFEHIANNEGLIPAEEVSKYILLDTGDVLPESLEENSADTKSLPTLYIKQTLRSGQTITYDGNIIIIGDAHPGSEIVAGGDITVWGILGGIAHAGSLGNITAKVRALKLNAIQLRIAGLYARRNDTLNVPYVQKSSEFTPEEAQIENGKIVIYKKLRRD